MTTNNFLIVWHSRTGTSRLLAQQALEGGGGLAKSVEAKDAKPKDFLKCSAYIFICPENLGSLTGAFKEMLDTTYYPLLGQIEGRPYGSIISAGSDGEGAQRQLDRILTGWRLRRVCDPHIVVTGAQTANEIMSEKIPKASDLKVARDMGESFKQGLSLGVF